MSNAHIEFLRTRDIGEVLNASMYFIRDHFKPIMRSIIYIAGPVLIAVVVISSFYLAGEFSAGADPLTFGSGWGMLLFFINNLLAMLVTIVIVAVMYEYIFLCYRQGIREYGVDEVWYAVKKRIALYFIYSVLTGIITFIGFLFLFVPGITLKNFDTCCRCCRRESFFTESQFTHVEWMEAVNVFFYINGINNSRVGNLLREWS